MELGRLDRIAGRPDEALQHLDEGLDIVRGKDDGCTAWGLREKSRVMLERDPSLAQKYAEEAVELYERIEDPMELAVSRALLGRIYEAAGNRDAAYNQFRSAATGAETDDNFG
jgi:tetratricopeptide (TPR) repeat protein